CLWRNLRLRRPRLRIRPPRSAPDHRFPEGTLTAAMAFNNKTSGSRATLAEDELGLIRTLAGILDETGLTEIEIERKGTRVRVSRAMVVSASLPQIAFPAAPPSAASPSISPAADAAAHPG